jgi:hypothetical protein
MKAVTEEAFLNKLTEIRIEGKTHFVPSIEIDDRTVIVTGRWLQKASIHDEELVEGEIVNDPEEFISRLKYGGLAADVFTFSQKPNIGGPKYTYHMEWDNWAAIKIGSFKDWWENRLPQESRKNVRRAGKRGIIVRSASFNDDFVKGIREIYNESRIRQGRPFWHFGKDFEAVKKENMTYLNRSEFLGAYLGDELVGFIKIIFVDQVATLIQIIAKNVHHDKRPMSALLSKAVEVCEQRQASMLVYGKYFYGPNHESSLTEFKRRNGFEEIKFPRYYIPLSQKGRITILLGLHRGANAMIPSSLMRVSRGAREWFHKTISPEKREGTDRRSSTKEVDL